MLGQECRIDSLSELLISEEIDHMDVAMVEHVLPRFLVVLINRSFDAQIVNLCKFQIMDVFLVLLSVLVRRGVISNQFLVVKKDLMVSETTARFQADIPLRLHIPAVQWHQVRMLQNAAGMQSVEDARRRYHLCAERASNAVGAGGFHQCTDQSSG